MRSLEEIIASNDYAAGRELGHAVNDQIGDDDAVLPVLYKALDLRHESKDTTNFDKGYIRGREEG